MNTSGRLPLSINLLHRSAQGQSMPETSLLSGTSGNRNKGSTHLWVEKSRQYEGGRRRRKKNKKGAQTVLEKAPAKKV
jgi:hypothetical protein